MAAPLDRVLKSILMGKFINGLKEDVKAELRFLNPATLEQAMDMASGRGKNSGIGTE